MLKIAVVGGGITGLASAYYADEKPVTIFEGSRSVGGILRDYNYDGHNFFSGCQYFNDKSHWFDRMELQKEFYRFDHTYASYTDLFGNQTLSTVFAGPVYEGHFLKLNVPRAFLGESLADRCDLYPLEISYSLKKWLKFIGLDIKSTHHSSILGFQANRVYISGQNDEIRELKQKKQCLADMIYGLPRNVVGLPPLTASIPFNGFNKFFDNLGTKSIRNITFNKSAPVNFDIHKQKIIIKTNSRIIDSDLVIWTADPTKLINSIFDKKLDSQRFRAEVLTGFLDACVTNPFYIQVYSLESRVLRIYLYNIDGRGCFTIEKAFDDQNNGKIMDFCQKIICSFVDYKISKLIGRKKNIRFFAHTIRDHKVLLRLLSHKIENLIVPDFTVYGRDQKIETIYEKIKHFNT